MTDDWLERAACRGANSDLFFPWSSGTSLRQMTREAAVEPLIICATCPVREECLEEAVLTDGLLPQGVRGGLIPPERREIARARGVRSRAERASCGTEAGYYRHLRTLGEPACAECRGAHSRAVSDRAKRRIAS